MQGASTTAIARLFDSAAAGYDTALLQRVVYRANHDAVLAALRPLAALRIADVGCGTGVLTARIERELAPESLSGVDPSEGMLARARARSARIEWHRATAEHLPFRDASLDAVVTTEAFHFFDQPVALAEFHRVLVLGGHLIIASFNTRVDVGPVLRRLVPVTLTTPERVGDLVEAAGFTLVAQQRVGRALRLVVPTTATVARRPTTPLGRA